MYENPILNPIEGISRLWKQTATWINQPTSRRILATLLAAALMPATHGAVSAAPLPSSGIVSVHSTQKAPSRSNRARVIVTFTGQLSQQDRARLTALGCDIYRSLPIIDSAALSVPKRELAALSALSFVKHVEPDSNVAKCDEFTTGSSCAPQAYQQYSATGAGVTVAILDSGIYAHPDLTTGSGTYYPARATPATAVLPPVTVTYGYGRYKYSYTIPGAPGPGANGRIVAAVDFTGSNNTNDTCGHGTHVAGILGGDGYYSTPQFCSQTYYGIARNVQFVNAKVLNGQGQGSVSNVLAAIQWVIANASTYNIRVINLSLGQPVAESYTVDPLCQAVEAAWKSGIVVVCAAGNYGHASATQAGAGPNEGWGTAYGSIQSPANDPYVITVGATKSIDGVRADDKIATYSSRGPTQYDFVAKPDIVAPGNLVVSTLAANSYLQQQYGSTNSVSYSTYVKPAYANIPGITTGMSGTYFILSGTSMASPVVAGAAALLLQQNPGLSPDTIKARLMMSTDPLTFADGTTDTCTFGAGYLDIVSALQSNVTAQFSAKSPQLFIDNAGDVNFLPNGNLWGAAATNTGGTWVVSPGASIWGTGVTSLAQLYGSNAVTASTALWGDGTLTSSTALWGDDALWGETALWGDGPPSASGSAWVDLSDTALWGE